MLGGIDSIAFRSALICYNCFERIEYGRGDRRVARVSEIACGWDKGRDYVL